MMTGSEEIDNQSSSDTLNSGIHYSSSIMSISSLSVFLIVFVVALPIASCFGHASLSRHTTSFLTVTRTPTQQQHRWWNLHLDAQQQTTTVLQAAAGGVTSSDDGVVVEEGEDPSPLCDLQTFLRMTNLVQSGGHAKTVIQGGECLLNGAVETRRAKKLFPGDQVAFGGTTLDVSDEASDRGYVYKDKKKKIKPVAKVDRDGNLEFGGRYRSEEWRKERKQKKAERKAQNSE
jgi:ribosome-associated protein